MVNVNLKLIAKQFVDNFFRYVYNIFLPPWVFVWLLWLILSFLLFLVINGEVEPFFTLESLFLQTEGLSTSEKWIHLNFFILINYTFSFFLSLRDYKLRYFFVFISFVSLFLFSINLIPLVFDKLELL